MARLSLRIISVLLVAKRACVLVSALPRGYLRKLVEEQEGAVVSMAPPGRNLASSNKQCVRGDAGSDGVVFPLIPTEPTSGDVPDIPWLGTENQWRAPDPNDVRSPCPFLNTIANHGLINRSGKDVDLFDMARVVSDTFGLSFDFNFIIASMLVDFGIAQEDANGVQRVDLDDLCEHSPDPGVDNNFQEHDSSLFRKDFFHDQENHCNVDASLLRDVMQANPFSSKVSREEMQSFLEQRISHSRANNPQFHLSEVAVLEISAQYMTIMLIDTDAQGLTSFDSVDKDRLLEMMFFERIPQGFVRPGLVEENFDGFFPVIRDDTSPLGVRPWMPGDESLQKDFSAPILTEFLGSAANALGRNVDTCPDEGGTCSTTSECCPGFVCTNGNLAKGGQSKSSYVMIKGTARRSNSEWCWSLSDKSPRAGTHIVLERGQSCARNDDTKFFRITNMGSYFVISPKLGEEFNVGIRENPNDNNFDGRAWLRLERPSSDGTQNFFIETGTGYVAVQNPENHIVTTEGTDPNRFDPVMLKERDRADVANRIVSWELA